VIVITFAIEIGQGITGTGIVEFEDIMFGVVGFFAAFAIFAIIRAIVLAIRDR
jgi:glycopeptide antibiotics resistance protein